MERIGAGFIALLSAILYAVFAITASALVRLGFLIFRWAVIAAPLLGTVALLRPASAGLRRLGNAVVAALFNVVVFGSGAAIYLHAVDLVMNTTAIPGWLQVVLVLLCGVVGWLLLRPYRRVTQLGGKDPLAALFVSRSTATGAPAAPPPAEPGPPSRVERGSEPAPSRDRTEAHPPVSPGSRQSRDSREPTPSFVVYRPGERAESTVDSVAGRVEARTDL
jgi:hypothetical protein